MIAPLVQSLNLQIKGIDPRARIAAMIVLSIEFESIKIKLGYKGPGGWQQFRKEASTGERQTLGEFCRRQTGYSPETMENFHQCADAVRMRLRISSKPGARDLLQDMETPPSEMTKEQRLSLADRIALIGLTLGDSQSYLRKEFRAARLPTDKTTRHMVSPWPADDANELRQRAIALRPVVQCKMSETPSPKLLKTLVRCYLKQVRKAQS
jgi:hypothetical protein